MVATLLALLFLGTFGAAGPAPARKVADFIPHAHSAPHASTVTVIVMENRDDKAIVGNGAAPYINASLVPASALMTNSHAVAHPSQPNYLALFSGSTQDVTSDACPQSFSVANLGSAAIAAGKSFGGYSESMPSAGFGSFAGGGSRPRTTSL